MASTESGGRRRTYAEWYVWSGRNLASTTEIRHASAEAATEAKEAGGDPAAAARVAAQNRSGPGWTHQAAPDIRRYAEWYDWARTTLNLSGEALHGAAAAAIAEMERGGDAAAAAQAAGQPAAGVPTVPSSSPAMTPLPPPSMTPYGGTLPQAAGYPPGYAYGASPYQAPAAARTPAPFDLPIWVAILLGFGGGISLLVAVYFSTAIVLNPYPSGKIVAGVFSFVSLLMFASTLVALLGVMRRAAWARAMTFVAGVALCFSGVLPLVFLSALELIVAGMCVLFGLAVIIGAATARPAARRS